MPGFTLNIAVDELLKKEFDLLRKQGKQHPLQKEYGIEAKPVDHDKLNVWRYNFKGVEAIHKPTNLRITGAIDDLWQNPDGEYVVLDYKATSKAGKVTELGDRPWHDTYRRQLAVYRWLLEKNGLKVSDIGYWVYANGIKTKASFNKKLEFELTLISEKIDDSWLEPTLIKIKNTLEQDKIPGPNRTCEFCGYIREQSEAFRAKK